MGNANTYDGKIIKDPFELPEFVNWLRRSTRDTTCVLLPVRITSTRISSL